MPIILGRVRDQVMSGLRTYRRSEPFTLKFPIRPYNRRFLPAFFRLDAKHAEAQKQTVVVMGGDPLDDAGHFLGRAYGALMPGEKDICRFRQESHKTIAVGVVLPPIN